MQHRLIVAPSGDFHRDYIYRAPDMRVYPARYLGMADGGEVFVLSTRGLCAGHAENNGTDRGTFDTSKKGLRIAMAIRTGALRQPAQPCATCLMPLFYGE